ncbi:MAG: pyridoxamine 5'-phosphate oxidase family protein [Geminicoccaceae bacterium]|nr:pyridoxamine 5'-phosphate oxidase family protein [Geminicoccaceae bacterium]
MSPQSDEKTRTARWIMRRTPIAALGTIDRRTGEPYVSFVPVALDFDATPVLLLSDLSEHTLNVRADPRISLLFDATRERDIPADGARLTVQGSLARSGEGRHERRFIARHPSASIYAEFADFNIYAVDGRHAHLVEGFGKARWLRTADILLADVDMARLEAIEAGFHGMECGKFTVSGIDPDGIDLRHEGSIGRLWLDTPSHQPESFEQLLNTGARPH